AASLARDGDAIETRAQRRRARDKILQNADEKRVEEVPLYEYKCVKCGHQFEKIENVTASETKKCPKCGARAERMINAPAIQFKGSGWYVTDYAGKNSDGSSKDSKESKDAKDSAETKAAETKASDAKATPAAESSKEPAKKKKEK
ncbi:MAG: FmdB family zinc ribbon protein, partial [Candidatus Acidiferrales bacterium]